MRYQSQAADSLWIETEVKRMKYEIDRLVCTEEERQKVLPTGQFEVIKNTYMFFKIPVMNKVAPGKLVITYAAASKLHHR